MTVQGEDVQRHRDVSEYPDEALLCAVRGGHAWHLVNDYDSEFGGMMPHNPHETRDRVFNWLCTCGRRKREVWDKVTGESKADYGSGHLLMSGRAYVSDARKEWVSRLRSRGIPIEAATRILKAVE
jgi:hypothetical protein